MIQIISAGDEILKVNQDTGEVCILKEDENDDGFVWLKIKECKEK